MNAVFVFYKRNKLTEEERNVKKILVVFGTRPEGIKMAPIIQGLQQDQRFKVIVVNTAQHREMLDQVLGLFGDIPDYDLNLMKENQSLTELSSEMIIPLSKVYQQEQPDLVLVHGETTTTLIAAYVAFLHQIPIGHVEAGLHTYQINSPFPEEMNRQLVSRLATYHFACTQDNKENLLNENIDQSKIFVTGNSIIDALLSIVHKPI